MRHRVATKKLGKMPNHRKAMLRNMMISLFKHERIRTTKQKAKVLRSLAEKTITRAKVDSVHNRRLVSRKIHEKSVLDKLFKDIAPRFIERNGGYTRILKLHNRITDDAQLVFIELIDRKEKEKKGKKKPAAVKETPVKAKTTKTAAAKAKKPVENETTEKKADAKKTTAKKSTTESKTGKKSVSRKNAEKTVAEESDDDAVEKTVIKEKKSEVEDKEEK